MVVVNVFFVICLYENYVGAKLSRVLNKGTRPNTRSLGRVACRKTAGGFGHHRHDCYGFAHELWALGLFDRSEVTI
jgi:hypothetical protein